MTAVIPFSADYPSSSLARRRRVAGPVLSALFHLAWALWIWGVPLPTLKRPSEPPAVTVDIVTERDASPAKPAKPQPPAPLATPNLDEAAPVGALSSRAAERGHSGGGERAATVGQRPSRSERDVILGQVIRHWHPPRELAAFPNAAMAVDVTVLADGSLAPPFAANLPWNPAGAIEGYASEAAGGLVRLTNEAFYRALREAQPLRLTPAMRAKAPLMVTLIFRYRDVR